MPQEHGEATPADAAVGFGAEADTCACQAQESVSLGWSMLAWDNDEAAARAATEAELCLERAKVAVKRADAAAAEAWVWVLEGRLTRREHERACEALARAERVCGPSGGGIAQGILQLRSAILEAGAEPRCSPDRMVAHG